MTFVVGVHLGDSVGVLADTRLTVHYGGGAYYFDNALKVYQRPPLIIGLAGNAVSSDKLVTKFQNDHLVPLALNEAYERSVDPGWMISRLTRTYRDAIKQGSILPEDQFALVVAAENSPVVMNAEPKRRSFTGWMDATIGTSVQAVSVDEGEFERRLVLVIDFPSGEGEIATPGGLVMRGSGTISEVFLQARHTVLYGVQLSFGDRLASIAYDMVRAAEVVDHASFNAAVMGWARCQGYTQSVLHSLKSWPNHSVAKDVYQWEPFEDDDLIPETGNYHVGSDLRDFEIGWIYDVERRCKLRVEPIFNLFDVATLDGKYVL